MQQIFCLQLGPVRALHRASPRDQTRAKQLARFSAIIAETESRALCLHNGRSLQTKNLRSRLAKIPTFESLPVYLERIRRKKTLHV
jgi:hypothetical protein